MKVRTTKAIVMFPVPIARMAEISLAAKGLLVYLLSMEDATHITIPAISVDLRETESNIRTAAIMLEAYGFIEGLTG